jgi:GNAT superfamily N-acetyltransferase
MTALYNRQTADEKHIARFDAERFIKLVEQKSYFDPEGLLVAVEDGRVVGWVHACLAAGSESRHNPTQLAPRIRMLIFPRDRLKLGNVLVAEATAWLKRFGHKELLAMHSKAGYPFYRGLWLGSEPKCPATMPHLQLAFRVAGYKSTLESVFMTTEIDRPPREIHAQVKLEFVESPARMAHKPMRESWDGFEPMTIRAAIGSQEVGGIGWVMQPHLAEKLGAPCVNIWSMGVQERYRRRGIATALVSRVLFQAYQREAKFASVSTQLWNAPAHATYAKLGFKPYCMVIGRTLDLEAKEGNYE